MKDFYNLGISINTVAVPGFRPCICVMGDVSRCFILPILQTLIFLICDSQCKTANFETPTVKESKME